MKYLATPSQAEMPLQKIKAEGVKKTINDLQANKAPGYELITGKILKELPPKAIRFITIVFNAIIRLSYFPAQWKVAQIILIPKPKKEPEEPSS